MKRSYIASLIVLIVSVVVLLISSICLISRISNLYNQVDDLEKQVIELKSTIEALKDEVETKDIEINSLKTELDTLKNTTGDDTDTEEIPEFNIDIKEDVHYVTANDIVDMYEYKNKSKDVESKLQRLDGVKVGITGKVKDITFGSTDSIGDKTIYNYPELHLDNDEMSSFFGIKASIKNMTFNKFLATNDIDEGSILRVYGTGSVGLTFSISDCYYAELLGSNGEVISYWDTELAFDELPY